MTRTEIMSTILMIFALSSMSHADAKVDTTIAKCTICVQQYDECLSDLFQGLGSMDGDDIKNCQTDRDECLASIGKKI